MYSGVVWGGGGAGGGVGGCFRVAAKSADFRVCGTAGLRAQEDLMFRAYGREGFRGSGFAS